MAYDTVLADRIRAELIEHCVFEAKKMMGGIVFMVDGNMCCGVIGDALMVRIGEDARAVSLKRKHTRPMEFGGRSPKAFILVDPAGIATASDLGAWIVQARAFVATLPAKP